MSWASRSPMPSPFRSQAPTIFWYPFQLDAGRARGEQTLFSSTEDTGAQAATTATAGTTEIVLDDPRSDTPRTERPIEPAATATARAETRVVRAARLGACLPRVGPFLGSRQTL
ncbi:hypothetical protein [Streptomyces canus]|uniref:hypothetical protein n=1 Tax=Streptomyces canus TaxID=58343 RepID=UPI00131CB0C0|nr:hypothetical protein [Streptomyces canus]